MRVGILVFCMFLPVLGQSQWFDDQSINSTVSLEKWQDTAYAPLGTGFAIYNYLSDRTIIVTCEHLLRRSELYVVVNADSELLAYAKANRIDTVVFDKLAWIIDQGKLRAKVRLQKAPHPSFITNPSLDVGVFLIDLPSKTIRANNDTLRISRLRSIPKSQIRARKEVALGDELYFVGFPFGIGTGNTLEPLVRSGSVAWLSRGSHEFLLDAFSFGGNSGSPVFSKVIVGRKPGTLDWDFAALVGIITGHLGESVEGLLTQPDPGTPKITRESRELQNYGLARVVWIDAFLPLIEQADALEVYK